MVVQFHVIEILHPPPMLIPPPAAAEDPVGMDIVPVLVTSEVIVIEDMSMARMSLIRVNNAGNRG